MVRGPQAQRARFVAGLLLEKDEVVVLDAPEKVRAVKPGGVARAASRRAASGPALRRDMVEDFHGGRVIAVGDHEDEVPGYVRSRRFSGLRFRLKGGVPSSIAGRVLGSVMLLALLGGFTAALWEVRSMLLHDPRLVISSSRSIEITGNSHLSRPQLLSIFGEDVDRNVLAVPLPERRRELENLPWVEHATVMRLLPNRLRVAVVERTPVAFVRQGSKIGLVDAKGVLLDLSPENAADAKYSFPVVSGIVTDEPESTRAARMALYTRFMTELGADSAKLSEVDLSSPEDVKALIPGAGGDVLVHFGDDDFLKRYHAFETNLPGWKTTYPKLASVDMRYEHNVVLEMTPGAALPTEDKAAGLPATPAPAPETRRGHPAAARAKGKAPREAAAQKKTAKAAESARRRHLTRAFAVREKKAGAR